MGEQRASDRLKKGEKICCLRSVLMSHLHHVTMATLHQQQLMKGAREREREWKRRLRAQCAGM